MLRNTNTIHHITTILTMKKRSNRRGINEYFVKGQHLTLDKFKVVDQRFKNKYLVKENIPDYPRPEFHVSHLKHETDKHGLVGIKRDGGFRSRDSLQWWSLALRPEDITSAEKRLLEKTYPDRTEDQVQRQHSFLGKFATSPAFKEESRMGPYRFTFSVEEVLDAYSQQFCSGAQPFMQVYETVLYKQEVMYVVLVSPDKNPNYPLLSDDLNAVCVYKDGRFIWRSQAMCGTHSYELVHNDDENLMYIRKLFGYDRKFYIWDNVAVALSVKHGELLNFNDDQLRKNLTYCNPGKPLLCNKFDSFEEAEKTVRGLWPDNRAPLERERSLTAQPKTKSNSMD